MNNKISTVMRVPLINSCDVALEVEYDNTGEKKYLLKEALVFEDKYIDDHIIVQQIKAFIRKCNNNMLRPGDECNILRYEGKNIKDPVLNKLKLQKKIVFTSKNEIIELNDIEVEAMLSIWKDVLLGFSKVKFYEKFINVENIIGGFILKKDENGTEFKVIKGAK